MPATGVFTYSLENIVSATVLPVSLTVFALFSYLTRATELTHDTMTVDFIAPKACTDHY